MARAAPMLRGTYLVTLALVTSSLVGCAASAPAGGPPPPPPAEPPSAPSAPPAQAAAQAEPPPAEVVPAASTPAPVASAPAGTPAPSGSATATAEGALPSWGPGKGEASYYDPGNKGACSLNPPMHKHILAASKDIYQTAAACGACLEISGGQGKAIVQVMDVCSSCPPGNVVISKAGFEAIVGKQGGTGPISWQSVPCPVEGKVSIRIKDGATRDWTAVQIRDSRAPIKAVSLQREGGGDWMALQRSPDNYWSAPKAGAGDGGFKLQITAATGQQIEETIAKGWKGGKVYPGAGQF